jgi:hypothetical protein
MAQIEEFRPVIKEAAVDIDSKSMRFLPHSPNTTTEMCTSMAMAIMVTVGT